MKRYYFPLFLLIFIFYKASASDGKINPSAQQQYLFHITKAMLFSADSFYRKACDEYEIAFSYRKDYVIDLFECAKTYDKLNNTEKTLEYLRLSIENGCDWYDDAVYLPNLKKTNRYLPLSQFEVNRQLYYKNLNMAYFIRLEKLLAQDQVIRKIKKGDFAQITDVKAKNKLLGIVDSTNMDELKALIEKYGYPEYSTVGYQGETDVFILLLHGLFDGVNDSLDWAYYQPIILKEVKDGKLMPDHYAVLYDRVVSKYGKGKSCYGVQFEVKADNTFGLTPIYDIENVDIRRREIGLPTLGDFSKISKMKLPEGYIRK